ncbi:leucine-rich repeat protein [Olsenella uli]|uniref:leucine-rich repeat protein n=1 Tax=Olsenella uli TaxID=133926 RepID=UPI00044FEEB7|nr:leucine-rich repeat domain-containing protein [Olsenella uli]EUB31298.1 PF03382 family protein [Olsenella uli MSTE5]
MAVGTISTRILTDIANAIRYQAGVATTYKPRQMAAAVAALDGTNAGNYQAQGYMQLESGMLSESVFSDVADAIRGQNGLSTLYAPGDMAAAILALEWDVGYKVRALLLSDGTLEFNYYDRRRTVHGGTIQQVFEVDTNGYSSASARSWDSIKLLVKRVYIDSSIASVGITNCAYWFNAFANCTEVSGFENLSSMTTATQMFTSCSALETIYATSFTNRITSGTYMFNGYSRLVGGTDSFVPSTTSGASVCKLGAGGVLTDPANDARHWFWAHFYDDGGAVLTASCTPDATRTLIASGRICAEAKYQGLGFTPWTGATGPTHRQYLTSVAFAADMATFTYLNLIYLFYSCTNLASVTGLANLTGVRSMRYAFSSCAFTSIDFRGFDPSTLTDLFYCFSGCSSLVTIYADSTWQLPSSGISGSQCFYSCRSLVGGNGTAWSSGNTSYTYMRIDRAGQAGYLTAV